MKKHTLLIAAGAGFVLFPALRPWSDKSLTPAGMADAFASPWWLIAHGLGVLGFVLLAGALAVSAVPADVAVSADPPAPKPGRRGLAWFAAASTALLLPYYGAESLGLHGVALTAPVESVPAIADAVRYGPAAMTVFGLGLLGWPSSAC